MVIKVFVSKVSGNMEIKRKQEYVISILSARKIQYEEVDISDPEREDEKKYMRENSPPKEGQSIPLPPQVFNEHGFLADYEGVYNAVEENTLLSLLKLSEDEIAKSQPPTMT